MLPARLLLLLLLLPPPPSPGGVRGARAAGTRGHTLATAATERPARSLRTGGRAGLSRRTGAASKSRARMEDEDDLGAEADRLASPAAAELLASTVTSVSRGQQGEEEDGSVEEGVVIYAHKQKPEPPTTGAPAPGGPGTRFPANVQEPDIRLTSSQPPASGPREDAEGTDSTLTTLGQWTTAGSTPSRPAPSTALPAPESVHLVLMPWGPWHCHCKAGTMSRTRAGQLRGRAGRLRVGALGQLRTEHRPCTYEQCSCDRRREECPLDGQAGARPGARPSARPGSTAPRLRPTPMEPPSLGAALVFWRRVREGLEEIWSSLSSVFTEMQPIDRRSRR